MANIDIGGRLHSTATGNVVAGANEIYDDEKQQKQSEINVELYEAIDDLGEELNTKQDTITAVVTPEIVEDEGDPGVISSFTNNQLTLTFKNLKGEKGETGEKGDKGETGDAAVAGAGDLVLTSALGNSQVKAMSQDGITKVVMNNFVSGWKEVTRSKDTPSIYMQNDNGTCTFKSGSSGNHVSTLNVVAGDIIKVSVKSAAYGSVPGSIGFSTADPAANGTYTELYQAASTSTTQFETTIIAPADGKIHVFWKSGSSVYCKFYIPISIAEKIASDNEEMQAEIEEIGDNIEQSIGSLDSILNIVMADLTPPSPPSTYSAASSQGGTWRIVNNDSDHSQDRWQTGNSDNRFGYNADVSAYRGKRMKITPGSTKTVIAFFTSAWNKSTNQGQLVQYCTGGVWTYITETTVITIPEGASYFWCPWKETSTSGMWRPSKIEIIGSVAEKIENIKADVITYHVNEESGSDSNDGLTESNAFATVQKALAISGKDVSMVLHGLFRTPINITGKNAVRIMGDNARINYGTQITSAEIASGYTDVYEKSITLPSGYVDSGTDYGLWLWQSGVSDTSTAISQQEKHPCQRNKTYRLASTKITKVSSISAVASSEGLTYYYDSTNNKLYFKIAEGTTLANNPVVIRKASDEYAIFIQCNELLMSNVGAFFASVMLKAAKAELTECRCLYGANGFRFMETGNAKNYETVVLTRCEAGGCFAESGNGDGFGSSKGRSTLIDCWAHDCFDDGYSEHVGSESTIIGGLFEYCGKGGIVPSSTTTTIIGATCRHNGGKPTQTNTGGIFCVKAGDTPMIANAKGCVCYDNQYNYYIEGIGSTLILENCQSLNASTAGYNKGDSAYMILRNCTHAGTGSARSPQSSAAIIIENGTIVS